MRTLGRYQLTELLGQGALGEVWIASSDDLPVDNKVCVKVMKPELATNERAVELFLREARLAARLTHPHIVQIFELGWEQGTYFIAMEMLEGLAWHELAQRAWRHGKVLPLDVIIGACAQAASALHYAHTLADKDGKPLGVVHRDVSPENLFLTNEGTKVLDFGMAKVVSLAEKGELRGKLPFLSPEQVRSDEADHGADIWSLGVSLFYLSTAQRPFDRSTPTATMDAILKEPASSALLINPALPAAFGELIARCLQKDPKDRWPSALAVKEALLALLPAPFDESQARELLTLTTGLEKGESRPLSAPPSAPATSWDQTPPTATALPSSVPAAVPPPPTPPLRSEDRLPTRQRIEAGRPAARAEATLISAPLITADQSADDSLPSEEDFEAGATLAEMPSLSRRDSDDSDDSDDDFPRAEPTQAIAMTFLEAPLAVKPPQEQAQPADDIDLSFDTVAVDTGASSRARPRPPPEPEPAALVPTPKTPFPVWVFGVAAFGLTVVGTLLIIGLVHLLRR